MLRKLFKRNVYVKPVDATLFGDTLIVFEGNALQSFADDLRRYDWRVALSNLRAMLR
jgi:hypothetical protein